jgi:DNA repair protein SbcC/Rad50
MRLNRLQMTNFRQHVASPPIEFDSGLTGIIGPNGSGKSTILEAIAWALYGMPAARGTRESIRSIRAPARAGVRVELDFDLGGHRYRVVRGLTNAELYLDGSETPIANTITGVTELLRRRLGMSLEEFFNTYFTGQKELSVMAAMGPSERAQFLSRVLGYEKLRAAQNLVRDRRRVIVAEIDGVRRLMPDAENVAEILRTAESRLAAAEERLADASKRRAHATHALEASTPRWEAVQRERDQLHEVLSELRVVESEESGVVRELERIERELSAVAAAHEELQRLADALKPLATVVTELQRMDNLCREEGRRQTLLDTERAIGDELSRLRERRAKIETAPELEAAATQELEQRREELRGTEANVEQRRTEWVRDHQEAETKLKAFRDQYAELKEQRERIARLGEDGACPTCTRPLGVHYRAVLDDLDAKLETLSVDGKYYRNRLEQLDETAAELKQLDEQRRYLGDEMTKLERRFAKIQAAVQELVQLAREVDTKATRHEQLRRELAAIPAGYDKSRHEHLQGELARLKPMDARATWLGAQIAREEPLKIEQFRAGKRAAEIRERAASLRLRRDASAFSEQRFVELRSDYERCLAELRSAEMTGVEAEGQVASARLQRETAVGEQQRLAKAQAQLDRLNSERRLHDELDRAYTEMRQDLNVQLRPEISEVASVFLTELTEGRYAELVLDDQYNVIVLEDGAPKPVISGGEEDLANLVLRLAISQMIAERAGQSFSLLILDEIFGSLDEGRRHNVLDLLRRLNDRFDQVILITHIESVREGLDRVITVRYDQESGSSIVEQDTPDGAVVLPPGGGADLFDDAPEPASAEQA